MSVAFVYGPSKVCGDAAGTRKLRGCTRCCTTAVRPQGLQIHARPSTSCNHSKGNSHKGGGLVSFGCRESARFSDERFFEGKNMALQAARSVRLPSLLPFAPAPVQQAPRFSVHGYR